jgi:hypothetical protein
VVALVFLVTVVVVMLLEVVVVALVFLETVVVLMLLEVVVVALVFLDALSHYGTNSCGSQKTA